MKMAPRKKAIKAAFAGIGLLVAGAILLLGGSSFLDSQVPLGIKPASADSQYGILGRQAPELELNTWINANGKPMDPLRLEHYRGKVIYLYFFQDW